MTCEVFNQTRNTKHMMNSNCYDFINIRAFFSDPFRLLSLVRFNPICVHRISCFDPGRAVDQKEILDHSFG